VATTLGEFDVTRRPAPILALALATLFLVSPTLAEEPTPLTWAEASGFEATSRNADVAAFLRKLAGQSDKIRIESIGTSAEGRSIPMAVIGDPVPTSPADLRRDDRAVVYFQANIHSGEVEGKEALQMLARDLVQGKTDDYLDRLVILIVPVFNVDGNDKISTENRTRQHGPSQGVGERYNGQKLDLNRDGAKLETPEVRGLVENALLRWDPVFFLDSHTHNGSYHQEPVTWVWGLNPNGDPAILKYMETVMLPAVTVRMREFHGTHTIPHGDFLDVREPEKGWTTLGPQPRYLSNYVGLRNRLSVLNEQYPYVDFEDRVQGAYDLFTSFLDMLHAHRDTIVTMVRDADRRAIERPARPPEKNEFIVEYDREPIDERLTIRGWEMEVEEREGRWPRVTPTETEKVYTDVPYLARYTAKRTVPYPRGYLITARDERIVDNLMAHGITVDRLVEPATLSVESFKVTAVQGSERLNQGHYTSDVEGEYETVERTFPAGTLYVSTAQALGPLAASLLEPESDDGLVAWNFFDRYLQAQWGNRPQTLPVFKVLGEASLVTERVGR
jgi:hypothetical protein